MIRYLRHKRFAVSIGIVSLALTAGLFLSTCSRGGGGGEGPLGPTSFDLIDQALQEGRISEETAMTYKALSLVGHPQLPAEFKGESLPGADQVSVLAEIKSRGPAGFSAEHWELLIPIFRRPYDLDSYFYPGGSASLAQAARFHAPGLRAPRPDCARFQAMDTANGIFRVYYESDSQRDLARAAVDALDNRVYGELIRLMGAGRIGPGTPFDDSAESLCGAPDEQAKYDIFITSRLSSDDRSAYAVTYLEDLRGTYAGTSYILINANNNTTRTVPYVVAHELMHSFQFTYDVASDWGHTAWLREATATWVEWHVYPDNTQSRSERHVLASYLLNPGSRLFSHDPINEVALDDRQDYHQYGAYLWFFFLSGTGGAEIVRTVWENSLTMNSRAANNAAIPGGFERQLKEFTFQNYNKPPADLYQTGGDGALNRRVDEFIEERFSRATSVLTTDNLPDVTVYPLAAAYYKILPDSQVRYMKFQLDLINAGPGAGLIAIVRRAGESEGRKEDWSGLMTKEFCRDKPTENVEEIILILSNSNWDAHELLYGNDIFVDVTTSPCFASGTGSVTQILTSDSPGTHEVIAMYGTFTATYQESSSLPGGALQFFVTGQMTFSYEEITPDSHTIVPPCTFAMDPEFGGVVGLFYPNDAAGIPEPVIGFSIGIPAALGQTCPGTTTDASGSYAFDMPDLAVASTVLIPDVNSSGLPVPGIYADTFVNDFASFEDSKTFDDAGGTTTYETRFDLRLPAGQRL